MVGQRSLGERGVFLRASRPVRVSGMVALLGAVVILVTGCGGSRQEAVVEPETPILEGQVTNRPLVGSAVEVFAPAGPMLGTTSTDGEGRFSLAVEQEPPFRVIARGGALEDEPYEGTLAGWCESLTTCLITPISTALLRLIDEHGFSSDEAWTLLTSRVAIEADPFADADAAGEGFELNVARDAIDRGRGLDGWLDSFVQWLRDADAAAPPGVPTVASFVVTPSAGTGGSISPSAAQQVSLGATVSFTLIADPGYGIAQVGGSCAGELVGTVYTTEPVVGDCTISASFEVTLAAPANVEAERGDGLVSLRWDPVADAAGYNVYWGTTPGIHPASASSWEDWMALGDVNEHTIGGLDNGVDYYFVITATLNGAESAASEEVSARPGIPEVEQGVLNDTGITRCGNDSFLPLGTGDGPSNSLLCGEVGATVTTAGVDAQGNPVPAGQDALHGRDAKAKRGELEKVGGGEAGFDFTKLGASGEPIAVQDRAWELGGIEAEGTHWSCVRDNRTGLIWEVKHRDASHLRYRGHTYTWFNPDPDTNGGEEGVADGGQCMGSTCDTDGYVQAVNAAQLCGADSWTLPTRQQLLSLMHNGRSSPATIDPDYFPNTLAGAYWSSSVNAWAFSVQPGFSAWFVNFQTGAVMNNLTSSSRFGVRLVRTSP